MTDDQIIEAAIQGHASTRDAIRWAMKQVRMQSNTHQLPSVSELNTHQPDDAVSDLLRALKVISVWAADGTGWKDPEDIRKLADDTIANYLVHRWKS